MPPVSVGLPLGPSSGAAIQPPARSSPKPGTAFAQTKNNLQTAMTAPFFGVLQAKSGGVRVRMLMIVDHPFAINFLRGCASRLNVRDSSMFQLLLFVLWSLSVPVTRHPLTDGSRHMSSAEIKRKYCTYHMGSIYLD